jgi:FtsP/CotA-like multicopper oxidase with cupredoxin domain
MSFSINRRALLEGGLCLTAAALAGTSCTTALLSGPASGQPLRQPPEARSAGGVLATDVRAAYSGYDLGGKPVFLRGYDGLPVGRTLRVRAGDQLRLHLWNDLPWEPAGQTCGGNVPHALNTTNMHLHGVHVSPNEPSDYILLALGPKGSQSEGKPTDYPYIYDIPPSHPPGTYFYHAHYHGSVAMQVASGMSGCLIIEGEVDDIPEIRMAAERVLLVQSQSVGPDGTCEDYAVLERPGPTYVNAQLMPVLTMDPGEVQRWRLVNATHDRLLRLTVPEPLESVLLCTDGNPLPAARRLTAPLPLVPGNRADLLVKAPRRPGRYVLDGGGVVGPLATIVVRDALARDQPLFTGALPSYAHLAPIRDSEVTMGRRLGFGMTGAPEHLTYTINNVPFSCDTPWTIPLNAVEEWEIYNPDKGFSRD